MSPVSTKSATPLSDRSRTLLDSACEPCRGVTETETCGDGDGDESDGDGDESDGAGAGTGGSAKRCPAPRTDPGQCSTATRAANAMGPETRRRTTPPEHGRWGIAKAAIMWGEEAIGGRSPLAATGQRPDWWGVASARDHAG
ncbi:hypothetical protein OG21DRAFT_1523960 [Imleria badia]|nr:hypothetical protein OG21DRAFT_1523960 [Imleria badia]